MQQKIVKQYVNLQRNNGNTEWQINAIQQSQKLKRQPDKIPVLRSDKEGTALEQSLEKSPDGS